MNMSRQPTMTTPQISVQQIETVVIGHLARMGYATNEEVRSIVRHEVDNHDFKTNITKLLEKLSLSETIRSMGQAEISKILPDIIRSHLRSTVPVAVHSEVKDMFPAYLNSNPAVQSEMQQHLIRISAVMTDKMDQIISRLVAENHSFITQKFVDDLARKNNGQIQSGIAEMQRKHNNAMSELNSKRTEIDDMKVEIHSLKTMFLLSAILFIGFTVARYVIRM
jgi:polyhydroxyalkanoate synthesis regulator phasin